MLLFNFVWLLITLGRWFCFRVSFVLKFFELNFMREWLPGGSGYHHRSVYSFLVEVNLWNN